MSVSRPEARVMVLVEDTHIVKLKKGAVSDGWSIYCRTDGHVTRTEMPLEAAHTLTSCHPFVEAGVH